MRTCNCGHNRFYARQETHDDIIVDQDNNWFDTIEIYYAGTPFGPYVCTNCGAQYDDLEELKDEDSD